MQAKIVIDLDGVIAGPKPVDGSYADCPVDARVVRRLRELRALGWHVCIHTARNVRTYGGDLGLITQHTVPVIQEWLDRHGVPCDSLVVGKPWSGETGVYVDDRAVRPNELLELSSNELLNQARGVGFDPARPYWRRGNTQGWAVIDLRDDTSGLVTGTVSTSIEHVRETEGWRTLLILAPSFSIPPGLDEELRRSGARWARYERGAPIQRAANYCVRDLVLDGLASNESEVYPVAQESLKTDVLPSRHFNLVRAIGERVSKTSADRATQDKLEFERSWLEALGRTPIVPPRVAPIENGYGMARSRGGNLAQVLLRQNLSDLELFWIADALRQLWADLSAANPREKRGLKVSPRHRLQTSLDVEHDDLFVKKTWQRLRQLNELLRPMGLSASDEWRVNGVSLGGPDDVAAWLVKFIPTGRLEHRGVWHGDLCPGNVLLDAPIDQDDNRLRLIDPRGTVDGHALALFGDQRYDLGKLSHALRWSYDALVEGWRDVQWSVADESLIDVRLRVWDEDVPGFTPNRRRVYDLIKPHVGVADVRLDDPVVHAIAALQLITCAPLHSDDPERMVALVARGLQAAQHARYAA